MNSNYSSYIIINLLVFLMVCVFACSNNKQKQTIPTIKNKINSEILKLNNDHQAITDYITTLYNEDTKQNAKLDYAKNKRLNYQNQLKIFKEKQYLLLIKIQTLINTYGYPTAQKHGDLASIAPFLIINALKEVGKRIQYYPLIYKGHKIGSLTDGSIASFLDRTYELKTGNKFSKNENYPYQLKIDTLTSILNLN